MLKFCIGTGVLAVPHAFSTGGVLPCALALLGLLLWNDWAGRRLIQARDLLDADALRRFNEGGGESPLAALTREVCGAAVAGVVEAVFFVLMFGVAVAYLVALHDFVRATPLAMPLGVDVALAAAAAVPLALVDDFGSLAAAGAAALVALACSLAAIALYGVLRRERLGWAQSGTFDWTKPDSVADVGAAVGVMAFCFGVLTPRLFRTFPHFKLHRRRRRDAAPPRPSTRPHESLRVS
jgi:amino acid permease